MKFTKHKITLLSIISVMIIIIGSFCSISFAKYIESRSAGQVVSRDGVPNTSIFLNPNIWTKGTSSNGEIVNPIYYMWVVTGETTGILVSPSKHITPVIHNNRTGKDTTMDMYVFEFKYTWMTNERKIVLIRANPDVNISNFTTFPIDAKWNQTDDILFEYLLGHENKYNYICIDAWKVSDSNTNSKYSCNRIDKASNGVLSWLNG